MLLLGMTFGTVECRAASFEQSVSGYDTDKWVWSPEKKEFVDRIEEKLKRETPAPDVGKKIDKRLKYIADGWIGGFYKNENGETVWRPDCHRTENGKDT